MKRKSNFHTIEKSKYILIGPAFPLRGGIANFNQSVARALKKKNISSEIISFTLQYPSFLFPGKTQYENGDAPENVDIKELINSINPISWIKTAKYIRKTDAATIVFNYWMPFFGLCYGMIIRLLRRKSIKKIALCHNIIPHEKRLPDNFLNRFFLKKCDGFITLSKSVLKELSLFTTSNNKKFTPHPIYDIFGPIVSKEKSIEKLKLDPTKKYLLFFGLVRKYKGLDLMLKALASDKLKELDNVRLIVAGEFYDNTEEYLSLIKHLNIQDKVILRNEFIPSNLVRYYFCAADLVVQTYHNATQSGVTQIAYHFERPMLVTNVGGLSEIVPHEKVGYISEKNPETIATFIEDFYLNNRETEFSKNVSIEKHRFSWDKFVNALEKVRTNC